MSFYRELDNNTSKLSDDEIINIILEQIQYTRPKAYKIENDNEIHIKNYFLSYLGKGWHRDEYIMLGTNPWSLILKANIRLLKDSKNNNKSINYSIDIILRIIYLGASSLIISSFIVFGTYTGNGSLLNGFELAWPFILVWVLLNAIMIYSTSRFHKKYLIKCMIKLDEYAIKNSVYKPLEK